MSKKSLIKFDAERKDFAVARDLCCSFCRRILSDGSLFYKGIAACRSCISLWQRFSRNLAAERNRRAAKGGLIT